MLLKSHSSEELFDMLQLFIFLCLRQEAETCTVLAAQGWDDLDILNAIPALFF